MLDKMEEAHKLVARAAGQLALALIKRRIKKESLIVIRRSLEQALAALPKVEVDGA